MSAYVLVVDDDVDVLAGMRRGLWRYRERFTCEFVASAREAMERLRTGSFAVALVDLEMPDIDGMVLLEHLRARHPEVVRIAFSGSCEAQRCLEAMVLAHRFIEKPCTTDHLVEHIEACLHASRLGSRLVGRETGT